MLTYKAYKNYIRKNHLYINKLTQLIIDNRLTEEATKQAKASIEQAKQKEKLIKLEYPVYSD